jgi:hypothetical protein
VRSKMVKWLLSILSLAIVCGASSADTIGPSCASSQGGGTAGDPGQCGGVVYSLTYALEGAPMNGNQLYDFTLTVNTSGLNTVLYPNVNVLNSVAIGVPNGSAVEVDSAPATGGPWNLVVGGTNSGGCHASNANFECAQATSSAGINISADGVLVPNATPYVWVFDILLPVGTITNGQHFASDVKATYDNTSGSFGGLQTSAYIAASPARVSSVPEPGTMALTASGLLLVGTFLRRR